MDLYTAAGTVGEGIPVGDISVFIPLDKALFFKECVETEDLVKVIATVVT